MYEPSTGADVLRTVTERAASVRTVESSGRVSLVSDKGDSITLQAALVAALPDRLRLRAWKFDRAVLDITVVGGDVWTLPVDAGSSPGRAPPAPPARQIAGILTLLSDGYYRSATVSGESDDQITVTGSNPWAGAGATGSSSTVTCTIDRPTRTARRFVVNRTQGSPDDQPTILLDDYRLFDGVPWPTRLVLQRGMASVTVDLDAVTLNGELAEGAFTPPPRAVREP